MEGISLTDDVRCEIEAHEHVMACYQYDLICATDTLENPEHEHGDECYAMTLICGKEYHKHTEECYYTYEEMQSELEESSESFEETVVSSEEIFLEEEIAVSDDEEGIAESDAMEEDSETVDEEEEYDDSDDPFNGMTEEEWIEMMEKYYGVSLMIASPENPAKERRNGESGKLYVVTELGEKEKDRVNEYLAGIGLPSANQYACIDNSENSPYIMHVGDTIWLRVYGEPNAVDDNGNRYYLWTPDKTGVLTGIQQNCEEGIADNGLRYVERQYKAEKVGDFVIRYNELGDDEGKRIDFYIRVEPDHYRPKEGQTKENYYDHADIEVSDGGNYTITETGVYVNGNTVKTITEYDTIIVSVNKCEIYDANGNVTAVFLPDDYEAHGIPGSTQYELTSKYRCLGKSSKWFWDSEAKSAQFDTRILLRPRKRTIIYADGTQDTESLIGQPDTLVPSAIFAPQFLNISSVVDANNKCPNHSGLDFTVQDRLNYYFSIPPASIDFDITKRVEGGSLVAGQCEFELYYVDDYMQGHPEIFVSRVANDANGKVDFGKQYFLQERDEPYHYIIREVIPAGAIDRGNGSYYYNGVLYSQQQKDIYVKVTREGATLYAASNEKTQTFVNTAVPPAGDEQYVDLKVIKNWSDIAHNQHLNDEVMFQVWRSVDGQMEAAPFSIYGSTTFTLNDYNHWSAQFNGLPLCLDGKTYTYQVREVNSFTGYTTGYNLSQDESGNITAVIENRAAEPTSITVQKVWLDPKGNPLENPSYNSVSGKLYRDYKIVPVPIQFEIYDGSGQYVDSISTSGYIGQNAVVMFQQSNPMGWTQDRTVLSFEGCDTVTWDGTNARFLVNNIHGPMIAKVQSNNFLNDGDSNIILHYPFSNSLYPAQYSKYAWEANGNAEFGGAYQTFYTSSETGFSAVNAYNRANGYGGMKLSLDAMLNDGVLTRNTAYSISFYTRYLYNTPGEIKLTLYYKSGGQDHWQTVVSNNHLTAEWNHLQNLEFKIPENCTDAILYLETDESGPTCCNLYLDEFIIAKQGTALEVIQNSKTIRRTNVKYEINPSITHADIPDNADRWFADGGWNVPFTLSKDNDWKMTFNAPDPLNEDVGKQYRYYAVEDSVSGYSTTYLNNKVAFNSEKNPITIQNKAIAYELPSTGGVGTKGLQVSGLLLVASTALAMIFKKRKRRSSA